MLMVQRDANQRSLIKSGIYFLFVPFFFFKTTKGNLFSDVLFGGLHEDSCEEITAEQQLAMMPLLIFTTKSSE